MSDIEALHAAIGNVLVNASNYPKNVQSRILGQDLFPLIEAVRDSVVAAGFTRPSPVVVSTVEELNALPVGSVVRKAPEDSERTQNEDGSWEQGAVAELRADAVGVPAWFMVGGYLGFRSHQADLLPARVLFRPDTEGESVA